MHTVHNTPFFIQREITLKIIKLIFFFIVIVLTIKARPHTYRLTLAKYNYYVYSSYHR